MLDRRRFIERQFCMLARLILVAMFAIVDLVKDKR